MKARIIAASILLLTVSLLINSCTSEDPIACFNYNVERNLKVQFLNCSESASHFEWNFGDGTTGTGINPTHTYASEGSYIVKLVAYFGEDGNSATFDKTIDVQSFEDPIACFTASDLVVGPGQNITFFNCSKNSGSFEWAFGDGNTATDINAVHSFDKSGKYRIKLTAYAPDGEGFDTTSVSIKVGDKYLTGIRLTGFPETNNGATWDPELPFPLPIPGIGVEPDIKISYKAGSASAVETDIAYDITSADLPFKYEFAKEIKIDASQGSFTAIEDDAVLGSTEMATWTGSLNDLGNDGIIKLSFNKVSLELNYTIK